jgi:hypothetical protein
MRLRDLDPRFLEIGEPGHWREHDAIGEADGVLFLCPKCFRANAGSIGTHSVVCWQPHVPQTEKPTPGRWSFEGSGYDDLTLVAGSSSVALQGGCAAHFFVRNGAIEEV